MPTTCAAGGSFGTRGRCSTAPRRQPILTDREQAFKELLIAEGSDWFWWYGDDHSSDHDLEFDELFRRHLRNVYQMLGQPVPEELFATNISTSHVPVSVAPPVGPHQPGAGRAVDQLLRMAAGGGRRDRCAIGHHDRRRAPRTRRCATLLFGFDLEQLYLRLDLGGPAGQRLAQGLALQRELHDPGRPAPGDYGRLPRARPLSCTRRALTAPGRPVQRRPDGRRGGDS